MYAYTVDYDVFSRWGIRKRTKSLIWQNRLTAHYFEFILLIQPARVHVSVFGISH